MTLLMGFSSWNDRVYINKYYNLFIIYIIIYIINKKYMNGNSEILMSEVEKWKSFPAVPIFRDRLLSDNRKLLLKNTRLLLNDKSLVLYSF